MASELKRSIHNQLDISTSPLQSRRLEETSDEKPSKELILRKLDLLPVLPAVLAQYKPHVTLITKLDISFSVADFHILNLLCDSLVNLRILHAKSCRLCDPVIEVSWPSRLEDLDFSRNDLQHCPQGITQLMYLTKLNLSGNSIDFIPPVLLKLPCLKKCLLLSNPISNIPKHICREGIEKMRVFLAIEPLPLPQDLMHQGGNGGFTGRRRHSSASISSLENCSDLRKYVLRNQSSFESGYESNQRHPSSGSTSSASTDTESSESSDIECDSLPSPSNGIWHVFNSSQIPDGYTESRGSQLCQVYLPNDCTEKIQIHEVKDLSLHPKLKDNELLITPVVKITPHGLKFSSKPAIIVLSHCTKRNHSQPLNLIPMCSNTKHYQATEWTSMCIDSEPPCKIFEDCVMFKTSHFSLFAVVASYPYPSSSVEVRHGVGGELLIPELPGFSLHVSNNCIEALSGVVQIRATTYYCDHLYRASDNLAMASACIGIEPHGMEFNYPVQITIPIPDYTDIISCFPEARLELWCSQESTNGSDDTPSDWEQVRHIDIHVEGSECGNFEVVKFSTSHFSWYELLWTICTSPLQKLGLGAANIYGQLASRARYVAIRFQAFISHPHGKSRTFGLVVTVYKFGDPLTAPSNYPLLVAESGTKRVYLKAGDLHVRVEGCFKASEDVEEKLERNARVLDFTGEDFCERFEFALNLKVDVVLPLQEGQMLGKLHFIQWEESNPIHKSYNLIMVGVVVLHA